MKKNQTILYRNIQSPIHPLTKPHPRPLPAGEGLGVGLCGFLYGAFVVLFSKRLLLPSKTTPFAFQNDSFYLPKGLLLQSKTNPFATQKDSF